MLIYQLSFQFCQTDVNRRHASNTSSEIMEVAPRAQRMGQFWIEKENGVDRSAAGDFRLTAG